MRRAAALLILLAGLAGCGGTQGQRRYSTPYGPAAHSQTFGLPPKGVALPLKLSPTVTPTTEMFDSVSVSSVPWYAHAVAGYTAGFWPTFLPLVRAFPHAAHVSIAIASRYHARCLDIEPGDATPSQATGWYRYMRSTGVARPCFYANLSTMPAVRGNLSRSGIVRWHVFLWDADWTYRAHLDAGYDATQWTDHALGRNLDESTVTLAFLGEQPKPPPAPKPRPRPHPKPKPKPKPHHLSAEDKRLIAYWTTRRKAALRLYHHYACKPYSRGPKCSSLRADEHRLLADIERRER